MGGEFNGGTVFRLSPAGMLTTVYNFCSQTNCTDGAGPSGLVLGTDGNFYGTTTNGGAYNNGGNGSGWGTVFKITSSGRLTTCTAFALKLTATTGRPPPPRWCKAWTEVFTSRRSMAGRVVT